MTGFSIRSAGYHLQAVAPYGDISTTFRLGQDGGGLDEVQWQMDLPYDFDHPALRRGARVEVMDGGQRVGQAILGEPGRTETGRSFVATGVWRTANDYYAFTAAGETTTTVDVAIDQAAARGCPLRRSGTLFASPLLSGDVSEGLNTVGTLVTALAVETSQYWRVNSDNIVRLIPPTGAPKWHLVPGVADPGVADDDYASVLYGRYRSSAGFATQKVENVKASARFGRVEHGVDLTPYGTINATRATNILNGLLAQGKPRLSFTDRLEVDSTQLLTVGGRPAPLSEVRDGQVVRAFGLDSYSQWLDGNPWLDFTIGEATWAGDDAITIAPVGLIGRTWEDLLTDAAPKRTFKN